MDKRTEALKLALEALDIVKIHYTQNRHVNEAITAIKEALAQPERTWVGLTPQERDEINEQVYGAVPHHVAFHAAIEAKLKEKNT